MICAPKDGISLDYIRSILRYDPETGLFTYLKSTSIRVRVGQIAGTLNKKNGRIYIHVKYKTIQASLLAWFYMTGEWPTSEVDHKDRNKSNNRWENLRLASHSENNANRGRQSNNTSGHPGVGFLTKRNKWYAQIKYLGNYKFLGYYDIKEDAIFAREIARKKYFGEFA